MRKSSKLKSPLTNRESTHSDKTFITKIMAMAHRNISHSYFEATLFHLLPKHSVANIFGHRTVDQVTKVEKGTCSIMNSLTMFAYLADNIV